VGGGTPCWVLFWHFNFLLFDMRKIHILVAGVLGAVAVAVVCPPGAFDDVGSCSLCPECTFSGGATSSCSSCSFGTCSPEGSSSAALCHSPFNSATSTSWYFPGGDINHYFMVNPITLPTHWTIETWIYPTSLNGYWLSYAIPGKDNCFIQISSSLTLNTWQHMVVTWDGTTNKVYNNGVLKPTGSWPASTQCTTTYGSLVIGQEQDSVGGGFNAGQAPSIWVDTVSIYNVPWSAVEVSSRSSPSCAGVDIYDATLFGAWYDGTVDHSGNGHTAVIYPSASTSGSCPIPQVRGAHNNNKSTDNHNNAS
jgi:hypothetical protein